MATPLGDLIRQAREARGWTLTELARRSEVDHALVSRIESGQRTGSPVTLHRLATTLELDPAQVLAAAAARSGASEAELQRLAGEAIREMHEYAAASRVQ